MRCCLVVLVAPVALVALVACGSRPHTAARDESTPWARSGIDWTTPPPLDTPAPFAAPHAPRFALPHGIRVVVVEDRRLPLVAIRAVHAEAGSRGDGSTPGLAALTLECLDDGAAPGGARVDLRIATDYASIEILAASTQLEASLAHLASISRTPALADAHVERVRRDRRRELDERRERPRTIAAQVFDRVVFGAHPYASPAEGLASTVATLTAADVRAFHARAYRPSALTLIVAGDVTAAAVQRDIERAFGGWRDPAAPVARAPALPAYTPQLALVDAPEARASVVLIGGRGDAAGGAGQLAGDVASSIVGGGIGARLDRELHARRGLTVGASASAWRGRWAGSWTIATTLPTDRTLDGIRASLAVALAAQRDITEAEVARARANLLAAARQTFETSAGTARAFERLAVQGLSDDWYASYADRLAALRVEDVRAAAGAWRDLSIVVVGDANELEVPLRELGLPVVRTTPDGSAVR